ncbi:MAG: lysophospholipid acyltransferase family protein [Acidimicrobiales bacterium]
MAGVSRLDRWFYGLAWGAVWAVMRLYWRVTYEGTELIPKDEPFILAPVHRSFLDFALVSGVTRRRLCYMAKAEVFKFPAGNRFLRALGAFPVTRGGTDREAMRQVMAVIARGEPVVMFPEGTRRSGPVVENLYEGPAYVAARTGVPIVPVGIGGSERSMRKGTRVPRPTKIHIIAGPPIRPPVKEDGTRTPRRVLHELTEELRGEVQRLFDAAQRKVGA